MRGSAATPRIGGISSRSHRSEHDQGLRAFGSVHVGPPVVLMEALDDYPEGELVVPVSCSFLFLQGSEWRETFDCLYFRRPDETEFLGFKTRVRSADSSGTDDGHWDVEGDLTVRDVTRPVSLDVVFEGGVGDPWGNARAAFSASATIDRDEFGLTWNQVLEGGGVLVGKQVAVQIEAEAVRRT